MSAEDELLQLGGGITTDGNLRTPSAVWEALCGAPTVRLVGADRRSLVGEIRLTPSGAGVYYDYIERRFALLSPDELAEISRTYALALAG